MSGSTVVTGSGAFLDGAVCEPLWRILAAELNRRRRVDGGQVRPEVAEAVDTLRAAASAYLAMSAGGHVSRPSADMVALSSHDELDHLSTGDLAGRLGVGERHARRLADQHGISPVCGPPYRWSAADAAALVDNYRRRSA